MTSRPQAVERRIEAFLDNDDNPNIGNPIHSTEVARQFGFKAALVGGVTVWGWATPAILEALGEGWLDRGWADFTFRQPTYPGDALTIRVEPGSEIAPGASSVRMSNQDGVDCVLATVGLGDAPWIDEYVTPERTEAAPPPSPLPALRLDDAPVGRDWVPAGALITADEAREYARRSQRSEDRLFTGERPRLHPGWIAGRAERLLRHNWSIPQSIHTRTRVQHLAPAYAGQQITTSARLLEVYERRAHHIAHFDCVIMGEDGAPLARLGHWTIFRVAPPEERRD